MEDYHPQELGWSEGPTGFFPPVAPAPELLPGDAERATGRDPWATGLDMGNFDSKLTSGYAGEPDRTRTEFWPYTLKHCVNFLPRNVFSLKKNKSSILKRNNSLPFWVDASLS